MLNTSITLLPSTSSTTIRKLKSLGIYTYFDLLNYFPHRYEDYSLISPIDKVQVGEVVTVQGKIVEAKNQYTRSRITIQKVVITDDTGTVEVNWFNQPYLIRVFKIGGNISVAGLVKQFGSKISIEPKEYEIINFDVSIHRSILKHTGKIIPIYSEKKGLSSRTIREKIHTILVSTDSVEHRMAETFPKEIISFNNLVDENKAYHQIHFPENMDLANKAKGRLAEEVNCWHSPRVAISRQHL